MSEKAEIVVQNKGVMFRTIDEMYRYASAYAKSALATAFTSSFKTAEDALMAIQGGAEVGLSPMQALQGLSVVNGKLQMDGQTCIALIRNSGKAEFLDDGYDGKEGTDEYCAWVKSKRTDDTKEKETRYTIMDAKTAGLWMKKTPKGNDTPWITYPKDMLRWKAYARHARLYYADVIKGLVVVEDYVGHERTEPTFDESVPRRSERKQVEVKEIEDMDIPAELGEMYREFKDKVGEATEEKYQYLWVQYITYILACTADDIEDAGDWTADMLHKLRESMTKPIPEPIQSMIPKGKHGKEKTND